MIPIKIKAQKGAKIPQYQSAGAAGADVFTFLEEPVSLVPGQTSLVPTGISIELPPGYEAQIRPRSGLALKHGITLLNTPGTIDSDYRGEIKLIVTNLGREEFTITNHMRIAQMVFSSIYRGHFLEMDSLEETERNEGGFGHSGL
ncbi:MAG: dUTP diphosphatase [Spirochaetae bacterium HGW-Spirochaetae-1]|jgi:dUTP pyrophosphatase|nr:MAG: dUTP diphosphatase [Spirochaetae bacterium HGW-Spirochaetae-1]